jgi:hypothetical protein
VPLHHLIRFEHAGNFVLYLDLYRRMSDIEMLRQLVCEVRQEVVSRTAARHPRVVLIGQI